MPELELTEKILSACSGSLLTSLLGTQMCSFMHLSSLVTPLDVVKVRMQSQSTAKVTRPSFIYHGDFPDNIELWRSSSLRYPLPSTTKPIRGTFAGLRYIVENEGMHNLWRGLSPTLMMAVPATVVYFVGYESIRNRLMAMKSVPESSAIAPLLAGASARVLAASLISPLELIRTNMQHLGPEGTVRAVLSQALGACRAQGPSVLFRGLVPTLWRDVPFSALYWTAFERARTRLRRPVTDLVGSGPAGEFSLSFLSGALSGALAAALTTPFDVAKTRTQISLSSGNPESSSRERPSMLRQLRVIWRTEGLAGLFTGLSPRIFKVAPACAIMIGSYEFCKAFFVQSKKDERTR